MQFLHLRYLLVAVVASSLLQIASPASADEYPIRPVTIVVPLGAGSSADTVARLIAKGLSERLHQPFHVENKPGAGTIAGAMSVARAPHDGYTLLFAPSGTLVINPALFKTLPYDVARNFTPIAHTTDVPLVLVTNPSVPVQTVPELITLAKNRPGQLVYASSGNGTMNHIAGEMLQRLTGIKLIHVPYRIPIMGLNDVVAGHVPLMFSDAGPVLPLLQEGRLRALGVSTRKSIAPASHIPPLASAGVPDFEAVSWHMVAAPAGVSAEVIRRLHGEISAITAQTEFRQRIMTLGLTSPPRRELDALKMFLDFETRRWAENLRSLGLAGQLSDSDR